MIGKTFRRLELTPPRLLRAVLNNAVWEGITESSCMALTFDDGPDPEITPSVLDTLDKIDAKATFFLVGQRVSAHPGLAAEIAARGHQIGNHTMTHHPLFLCSREKVSYEINTAREIIADATGIDTHWLRPPHGIFDITAAREFKRNKCITVLWSALSGDYRGDQPDEIVRHTSSFIYPGAVIVFHDKKDAGGMALPGILQSLSLISGERGIAFGRIDELMLKPGIVEDC